MFSLVVRTGFSLLFSNMSYWLKGEVNYVVPAKFLARLLARKVEKFDKLLYFRISGRPRDGKATQEKKTCYPQESNPWRPPRLKRLFYHSTFKAVALIFLKLYCICRKAVRYRTVFGGIIPRWGNKSAKPDPLLINNWQ